MGQTIHLNTSRMQCISAYLAKPAGAARGGIVVIQEIFGVNAHIRSVVDKFAQHGYGAIAPALFDHVETGVELGYDQAGIAKGRELVSQIGFDLAVEDVASAAEAIASAGTIGAVGYCWGGSLAFLCATRLALPSVCYYGARSLQFLGEKPKAPLLFHFGERDASIPPADIDKHRSVLPDAEIYTYPAGHGFNCDQRADFDATSSKLAWLRTLEFFSRNLGPGV